MTTAVADKHRGTLAATRSVIGVMMVRRVPLAGHPRPIELPGGLLVSAERHKGRIVVRVESLREER